MSDIETLKTWEGKRRTAFDRIDLNRVRAMQAALGLQERRLELGDTVPPLWHWLFFWDVQPPDALGPDGHPKVGGFIPPVGQPPLGLTRRMWAGGEIAFPGPLPLGVEAERTTTIESVSLKEGRSGPLCFVRLGHRIEIYGKVAVDERQDLVYRRPPEEGAPAPEPEPAPEGAVWEHDMSADPTLLFRYSALTFNGHRIHYDADYAREVEGYPGLVVHGPLLATLMAELAAHYNPNRSMTRFAFRARHPVFAGEAFTIAGRPDGEGTALWIADARGNLSMTGEAGFA